jgi:hypothetical protein
MKPVKMLGFFLIAAVVSMGSSCGRSRSLAPKNKVVTVTDCQPSEDPVEVALDDTVQWDFGPSASRNYAIHFTDRSPFSTLDPPIGQSHKVKGHFWCNSLGIHCYYEYVITKDGGKTCKDPGVHVGPGSG